ncbi:hypothetical protein OM960_05650 [Defluviimonas sp. CAU 1641]|uniref:Uncharacterized protein n=2 Tax=Defluviimonas salinarum TaxID=2992147 RepID=A0ABT3J056_9RHOB|nr:hypothetical protein [Defluviimonas salinarum]
MAISECGIIGGLGFIFKDGFPAAEFSQKSKADPAGIAGLCLGSKSDDVLQHGKSLRPNRCRGVAAKGGAQIAATVE